MLVILAQPSYGPAPHKPKSFLLGCPKCGAKKEVANRWLYKPAGACPLYCSTCCRFITSRRWQCVCKIPWIRCETHRAVGFACRGRRRLHLQPKRARPGTFEASMPQRKARRLQFAVPDPRVFGDQDSGRDGRRNAILKGLTGHFPVTDRRQHNSQTSVTHVRRCILPSCNLSNQTGSTGDSCFKFGAVHQFTHCI